MNHYGIYGVQKKRDHALTYDIENSWQIPNNIIKTLMNKKFNSRKTRSFGNRIAIPAGKGYEKLVIDSDVSVDNFMYPDWFEFGKSYLVLPYIFQDNMTPEIDLSNQFIDWICKHSKEKDQSIKEIRNLYRKMIEDFNLI